MADDELTDRVAEALTRTVEELREAYEATRADLHDQMGRFEHTRDLDPVQARDTNGRYLILDALTALVNAQAALLNLRRETHARPDAQ